VSAKLILPYYPPRLLQQARALYRENPIQACRAHYVAVLTSILNAKLEKGEDCETLMDKIEALIAEYDVDSAAWRAPTRGDAALKQGKG
jgi:hypothetical protein